jgi:predicted RNA methylase
VTIKQNSRIEIERQGEGLKMANAVLTDEVKDVLRRATVEGNVLYLPEGQLDRKLYEAVNKALANAGGKWKTRVGHVFPSDAAPKLAAMLGTGVSIDEKKRDQAFFTPVPLAEYVVKLADVRGHVVLEPSAGQGAIADACMAAGAQSVDVFEINADSTRTLYGKGFRYIADDFLAFACRQGHRYQRIVMNPPFTKNQDIKHVRHALTYLEPGGILVAIMLNNQTRKGFVELVTEYDPEIEEVERGAFKESGTVVSTLIMKIVKQS